jgi:transposase
LKNRCIHHAHISEAKFRAILKQFCADVPALTSAGLSGRSVQATQRLYDKFRCRILELTVEEAGPFAGEVEVDESYFGARRVRGRRGRWAGAGRAARRPSSGCSSGAERSSPRSSGTARGKS